MPAIWFSAASRVFAADACTVGGHRGLLLEDGSSEESGGWQMIEVAGEGIAESSAGGCEVVAG
jgi:hypothetical protein